MSVNDGIDKQLSSLSYVRIDDAARRVLQTGTDTLLAKLDLQSAYKVIPVHGDDRHLLGVRWNGRVCLDTALPFGLRSAPKIFSEWRMPYCGRCTVRCGRVFSAPSLFRRFSLLRRARDRGMCQQPGSRIGIVQKFGRSGSEHKIECPACCMTFLGIEIDTIEGCLRLPKNILWRLCELLREWSHKRACTKRELLSLAGLLHHAATVVKPGRMFVRRLIDLSAIPKELHFHVRLNKDARSDIWW